MTMIRSRDVGLLLVIVGAGVLGHRVLMPSLQEADERPVRASAAAAPAFEPGCAVPFIATSLTSGFTVVAEYAGTVGLAASGLVVVAPRMVIRARPDRSERLWAVEVGLAEETANGAWHIVRSGEGWVLDQRLGGGEVLEPGGRVWTIPGIRAGDLAGRWLVFSHVLENGGQRSWTYAHGDRETLRPLLAEGSCGTP